MVCDFVRVLGPSLAMPEECAAIERLAVLVGHVRPGGGGASFLPPDTLTQLHVQLLRAVLADETAREWWPAGVEPAAAIGHPAPTLTSVTLSRAAAPRRPPADAASERNWPIVAAAVALRLHEWLEPEEPPLLEEAAGSTRASLTASPLQNAVWALWAAPSSKHLAAHAKLPVDQKLALLAMLVHGASQTAAAARAYIYIHTHIHIHIHRCEPDRCCCTCGGGARRRAASHARSAVRVLVSQSFQAGQPRSHGLHVRRSRRARTARSACGQEEELRRARGC